MSQTKKLNLVTGITRGDKTIKQIDLREPKAGDLRGLKLLDVMQFDTDALAKLLPRISSPALTEQDVYQFSFADLGEVMEVISAFMETSTQPPTA
ncbi:MAG: phage tail protein [Gammaproteobacteria bacterium]|nr:MAG: phage tail protein [Gammaproteobacteria bacterium]